MTCTALLLGGLVVVAAAAAAGFIAGGCGRSRVPAPELSTLERAEPELSTLERAEPWSLRNIHAVSISTDVALLVAKPDDLQRAYRDQPRVRAIAASIAAQGQTHAIEILVDKDGRCAVRDGHHRVVAVLSLGHTQIAAQFIPVTQRIPGFARPADQVLSATARTGQRRP